MILLVCFVLLSYLYIRGRINIFYDENNILDLYDQALYSLCMMECLFISIELIYPHVYIELIEREIKLVYQMVLVLAMMKLHEFAFKKIWIIFFTAVLVLAGYSVYGIYASK